jgi:hypothetical protein
MKLYIALSLLFFFASCRDQSENYQYGIMRRQLTPDKRHFIYDYERSGSFVSSNEIFGRRLIAVNDSFGERTGEDVEGVIEQRAKDTLIIHCYRKDYEQPKDTFTIKTDYKSYDGIIVKRIYEQPLVGGGIVGMFDFDSVKVGNNQIRFNGVRRKFGDKKYSDRQISFALGEVKVYANSDSVTKIEIDRQYKSMNFSRINESGKRLYNQPEVLLNTYEFTPTKKINPKMLGVVGIFRDFNLANKH